MASQPFSGLGLKFLMVNLGRGQIHHFLLEGDGKRDLNIPVPFARIGLLFSFTSSRSTNLVLEYSLPMVSHPQIHSP